MKHRQLKCPVHKWRKAYHSLRAKTMFAPVRQAHWPPPPAARDSGLLKPFNHWRNARQQGEQKGGRRDGFIEMGANKTGFGGVCHSKMPS